MLTKRLEILFDPEDFKLIKKRAEKEGKTVASLVRDTLREKIIDKDKRQKKEAVKRLFSQDMEIPIDEWTEEKKKIIEGRVKEIETH